MKKHILLALFTLSASFVISAKTIGERRVDVISDENGIVNESQIWNITPIPDEPRTFLATNDGLFVYDGARLRRFYSPKVNALRDLAWDPASRRLYSAGNTGFGWWEDNAFGGMDYHSLEEGEYSARFRDFWRVSLSGGRIFFQSQGRVCIYNPTADSLITVQPSASFRYMHDVAGQVYVQDNEALFRLNSDGRQSFVCRVKDRVMNMVECGGRVVVALERTGLMELSGGTFVPLDPESNRILSQAKILSLTVLGEQMLVGTTQGGLFVTDVSGRIVDDGLIGKDNDRETVLSIATDLNGDIWMGTEAGVQRIDCHSNDYYLKDSRLGRVRGVLDLEGESLLIGSNKGAFVARDGSISPIPGTTGSVWSVSRFDGVPYIAHDQGLFIFENGQAVRCFSGTGVMSMVRCNTHPDEFICGTYNGLALFQVNKRGLPEFLSYIGGYTGFCRHIYMDQGDRLWIRDSQRGFICLCLNEAHTQVVERKDFALVSSPEDIVYAIELDGQVYLCCNREAYVIEEDGNLYLSPKGCRQLSDYMKRYGTPLDRNATGPFLMGDGSYATGLLGEIRFGHGCAPIPESLGVSQIEALGTRKRSDVILGEERVDIPFDMNTVLVHLAGNLSGHEVEYRGMPGPDLWKRAPLNRPVQISALPFGNHDLEFRIPESPEIGCTVRLCVLRPWYLTDWAICAYLILIIGIAFGVRDYYLRQARKEQERRRLKDDLKAKSKELANISFNNAKRNRQLNEIKAMLSDRKTVALIDGYLADESDWEKSEEYFNVIYDGLLEKLKALYPGISKTDMKICVYTKLNLSTKEIADIMNISARSVEMARYRLRKRLGLPPGKDISDMLKELSD
ncbi:MAG: hypothetical protein IJT74_07170 [Bacteroidales bacterium]|nr:hypothetical protein [Bacteroidales bacterium]